jgi:hypothetical protein
VTDEPEMHESFCAEKAEEAGLVARNLTTGPAKLEMLGIAAAYTRLASYIRHKRAATTTNACPGSADNHKPKAE